MNWKEHKKRLLKDPGFKKEYEALEPEYRLAAALIRLRLARGLTQEEPENPTGFSRGSVNLIRSMVQRLLP